MKRKIALLFTIVLMMLFSMACAKDNNEKKTQGYTVDEKELQTQVECFFTAVETEDYAAAEKLLHPDKMSSISELVMALEAGLGIDFQEGIEIVSYENGTLQAEDESVSGALYTVDVKLMVGETPMSVSFKIVRNENGFGIYSYNFAF